MNILARFRSPRCDVCGRKLADCPRRAYERAARIRALMAEGRRPMPEVFTAPVSGMYAFRYAGWPIHPATRPPIGDLVFYDLPGEIGGGHRGVGRPEERADPDADADRGDPGQ